MRRVLTLLKYELFSQSVYPYAFLVMLIVFAATYSPDFNRGIELLSLRVVGGEPSDEVLERAILSGYLINLKTFHIDFYGGVFSPWMVLGISAAYAFSICRDLGRERLRYMLSLPIRRSEYLLAKIAVVTILVLASYYLSLVMVLGLRFGFGDMAYTYPLVFLRDIAIVSSASILVAVATRNDLVTIFSGVMGKSIVDFIFTTYFVGEEGYNLIHSIEPYYSMGIIEVAREVVSEQPIRIFLLDPESIDRAITNSNLYTTYVILASLLFIVIALAIFSRREVD